MSFTAKLKTKWAIKTDDTNFVAYRNTLEALGYHLYSAAKQATSMEDTTVLMRNRGSVSRDYVGAFVGDTNWKLFENIEQFLIWHWQPELTPEQKEILELEEVINKAQEKITAIKQRANLK